MSNSFKIRNYIKAKSPRRLRSLMFAKQVELSMVALEFDITYAKGDWFAWYYEVAKTQVLEDVVNDTAKDN